ncbi:MULTISPECIES: hypothetical protein [unclassified Streptomyces]|uniref:hypothetical protein n=1 Tax=unclassified Streptomyces TaxID=2593676 RepID=UPI000B889844|nr:MULTISPECIES: hypothetical protein [unclassified Streptomyces]
MDPRGHSIAKRPVVVLLFAAITIYLVRMWISDIAILLGPEFCQWHTQLERAQTIGSGHPPGENLYVEPGDARKL